MYAKRVSFDQTHDGKQVSLYAMYDAGVIKKYLIVVDRRREAMFLSRDAALMRIAQLRVKPPKADDEDAEVAARKLMTHPQRPVHTLRLSSLAYIARERAIKRGVNPKRVYDYSTIVRKAPEDNIPWGDPRVWIESLTAALQPKSKGRAAVLFSTLQEIIDLILEYPTALQPWQDLPAALKAFTKTHRKNTKTVPEESYPPFPAIEIHKILSQCTTMAEICSAIVYLSGGFRAGEAERVRKEHIRQGKVQMREIVTKTDVAKSPQAALALLAAVEILDGRAPALPQVRKRDGGGKLKWKCIFERKRFRPTCATYLCLAGAPPLVIADRLNHANILMTTKHYAKISPPDIGNRTLEQYLGVGEMKVGGHIVNENTWDKFCLKLLLEQAKRFGCLERVKEIVVGFLEPRHQEAPGVVEF